MLSNNILNYYLYTILYYMIMSNKQVWWINWTKSLCKIEIARDVHCNAQGLQCDSFMSNFCQLSFPDSCINTFKLMFLGHNGIGHYFLANDTQNNQSHLVWRVRQSINDTLQIQMHVFDWISSPQIDSKKLVRWKILALYLQCSSIFLCHHKGYLNIHWCPHRYQIGTRTLRYNRSCYNGFIL